MTRRLVENAATLKASEAMHPLGRVGEDDAAAPAAFLVAPAAAWITGLVIAVDGGLASVKLPPKLQAAVRGPLRAAAGCWLQSAADRRAKKWRGQHHEPDSNRSTLRSPSRERNDMKRTLLLSFAALALVVAACGSAASPTPSPATPAPSAAAKDIVETATAAGSFKTLLTAATAAGLVDTLKGEGPFTVFAPTDEAFAALPAGTLDGLLKDPEALKKILLYHVVSGKVTSDQVAKLTSANSVEGSPIKISVKDGNVYLNDSAMVVTPDIETSNGVIHVIDKVILPPGM